MAALPASREELSNILWKKMIDDIPRTPAFVLYPRWQDAVTTYIPYTDDKPYIPILSRAYANMQSTLAMLKKDKSYDWDKDRPLELLVEYLSQFEEIKTS